ncbi:hypothetical protein P3T76_005318 [Phytophthora citrophthora]|uniref:Uncharacterized protein n=1 Tax=Phytophthora citrophthora TaxID=4793 RepID=A0AAD9GSJ8_9STRA|nr:hypothetical protein P3T76_005318 [Phytophthora citrophthora]
MLSRVEDVRVFESSDDVILRSSSRRYSRQQLNSEDAEENEQLHPQHPYRMRKRVLQRGNGDFHQLNEENDQVLVPFWNQENNKPMEFVFLSSGEIRAREDCPPGLGLPKLQDHSANVSRRLAYNTQELSYESDDEDTRVSNHRNQMMKLSRQQVQKRGGRQNNGRSNSLASSLKDADVSSDSDSELDASKVSEEDREEARAAFHAQHRRQATRNAERRVDTHDRSRKRAPPHSLELDHLRKEEEEEEGMSDLATSRVELVLSEDFRQEKSPISAVSTHESARRERPAPLEQGSQLTEASDVRTRRSKRSPKMEVSHLVSEEPTPQVKGVAAYSVRGDGSSARKENEVASQLKSELQKEKKRVLEKVTQLLDEQGNNQQLRGRVEALEAQLAGRDGETDDKNWVAAEQDKLSQSTEKEQATRINVLEEQVRAQEAKISRLKHEKEELNTALKQLKKTGNSVSNTQRLDAEETGIVREELDEMTRRLQEFLAQVENWKDSSKKEMQHCKGQDRLPVVLERLWLDFPQFPGVLANVAKEKPSSSSEKQHQLSDGEDQVEAVHFLKKRLHQREEELRQIHVKYVELKELCARQCVREADLQNFINEHRLRGNLIIRKTDSIKPNGAASNQEPVQDDQPQRSTKLKMISSRGTNTPASYTERGGEQDDVVNDEYSDNQEDNDDYEEGDDYDYPVRAPKVFVQVGLDGVYEHASPTDSAIAQKLASRRNRGERKKQQQRVERIRLVPSPSLTQRHERVPTPTSVPRRNTSAQQSMSQASSSRHHSVLGECPPGCGSRPSFMRRKASPATRAKASKRPVSSSASRGAVGVIRPWM